jgi:hypothetical protein
VSSLQWQRRPRKERRAEALAARAEAREAERVRKFEAWRATRAEREAIRARKVEARRAEIVASRAARADAERRSQRMSRGVKASAAVVAVVVVPALVGVGLASMDSGTELHIGDGAARQANRTGPTSTSSAQTTRHAQSGGPHRDAQVEHGRGVSQNSPTPATATAESAPADVRATNEPDGRGELAFTDSPGGSEPAPDPEPAPESVDPTSTSAPVPTSAAAPTQTLSAPAPAAAPEPTPAPADDPEPTDDGSHSFDESG